jgi:hypothetical protein
MNIIDPFQSKVGILSSDIDVKFIEQCVEELERCKAGGDRVERIFGRLAGGGEGAEVKRGVISALQGVRERNALYFIVRSLLLQLISGALFLLALAILVNINFPQAILLGISIFITSLVISKLLDLQLNVATKAIIAYLDGHERIKNAILNYF